MLTWTLIATTLTGVLIGMLLTGAAILVLYSWHERDKEEAETQRLKNEFDAITDEATKPANEGKILI